MCKDECRWKSLKRGITLHLSMIFEKVNLLNFFFSSLSGKAKTISNKRNHKATTVFLEFLLVFNVLAYSFLIIKHQRLLWWQNEINEKRRLMNSSMLGSYKKKRVYEHCTPNFFTRFPLSMVEGWQRFDNTVIWVILCWQITFLVQKETLHHRTDLVDKKSRTLGKWKKGPTP